MVAWITAEGTSAKWNPLATTQSATGATNFNSHGVKNYPDRATGLQATKETITNGFYAAIISAFQAANDPQRTTRAIDSSVWGTKHATGALPAVQSHRPEAYGGQIPGGSASTLMVTRAGLPTVTPLFPVGAAGPNPPTTPAPQPAYPSPVPDTDPPNANATRTHELGFPDGVDLTINGAAVTRTQKTNMEKVLNTGNRMGVRRMFMRAALIGGMRMTKMISESGDIRPNDQNFNQIGLFQFQQDQWPQLTLRSIQVSTEHFYRQARKAYANYQERRSGGIAIPGVLLDEASAPIIASLVLGGQPADYENYMTEANVAINAFFSGETDSPGVTDLEAMDPTTYIPYEFSRGTEDNPDEDSWSCITRLADEVNWRAFVVDDTVFYVRDDRLLRNKVLDTIEEFEEGVDYIDFDYDTGKPIATLSIGCRSTRWGVPPGTTIKIPKMGPATGKYIVSDINRSLFSASADITLVSPEPQLMEPAEQEGDLESGLGADFDTSRGTAKVLAWAMSKVPNPPKPSTYVLGAHHDISNSEANLDYMRTHPGAQPPFDCSSFVCWAWAQVGVYVGSVTGTQIQRAQSTQGVWCGGLLLGQGVSSGMQPEGGWQAGDLFFPHSGHVTMATGNGRECVEAKGSHYGIVISPNRIPDLPYFWCRWSAKIPEQYR
jgi:hypothetical protein